MLNFHHIHVWNSQHFQQKSKTNQSNNSNNNIKTKTKIKSNGENFFLTWINDEHFIITLLYDCYYDCIISSQTLFLSFLFFLSFHYCSNYFHSSKITAKRKEEEVIVIVNYFVVDHVVIHRQIGEIKECIFEWMNILYL